MSFECGGLSQLFFPSRVSNERQPHTQHWKISLGSHTLMFPLPHDVCRGRAEYKKICHIDGKDGYYWSKDAVSIILCEKASYARGRRSDRRFDARISEGKEDGKGALEGEVDWEDGLLQRGELWASKCFVSNGTCDERLRAAVRVRTDQRMGTTYLEYGGAKKYAIAKRVALVRSKLLQLMTVCENLTLQHGKVQG